jgi:hypothetical protein
MKRVAVSFLMIGMLCNSMRTIAEGPIPFNAIMQSSGAQPAIPSASDAQNTPRPAVSQQAPHRPMTTGGKVMVGVGIGFVGFGALLIAAGTTVKDSDWFASESRAVGFGGGAAFAGVGTTLIVFGWHRRTLK